MNYRSKLLARDDPIRVGIIGAGSFGSQMILAIEETPGMTTAAVADIETANGVEILRMGGVPREEITTVEDTDALEDVVRGGDRAVIEDGVDLARADLDVVVEATGNANVAARTVFTALTSGSHVVNVTIQADAVVGPLFGRLAEQSDVSYSLAYGDQPGRIVELCDRAITTGYDIVAAGRTIQPIHRGRHRTPDDEGAGDTRLKGHTEGTYNPASDGTKVGVEMCVTANALGLGVDTLGLHMPTVALADIPETLIPETDGGVLGSSGVVDAVESADHTFSTFVVTTTPNEHRQDFIARRKNVYPGVDGTYQVMYAPHHSAAESTVSIASLAIDDESTGSPVCHAADVVGVAKRDLEPGETLDGGAGYTAYGLAESAGVAAEKGYVPVELLDGATVEESVARDEPITRDDVSLPNTFLVSLRRLQDELIDPV